MEIKNHVLPLDHKSIDSRTKELSKTSQNTGSLAQAEKVAEDFETLFMDMMVKSMRQNVKSEEESNAMDIFQGMLDSEYAKMMTAHQNFGLRDTILDWLKTNDASLQKDLSKDKEALSVISNEKKI